MATPDLLDGLRPVRLPAPPPSSLIEMLVLGAACGVLGALLLLGFITLLARWRARQAPLREALLALKAAARLPPAERACAQARLLRRYVASVAGPTTWRERGATWLTRLDGLFSTDFFSRGGGRIFGEALYRPLGDSELGEVDGMLSRLLRQRGRQA